MDTGSKWDGVDPGSKLMGVCGYRTQLGLFKYMVQLYGDVDTGSKYIVRIQVGGGMDPGSNCVMSHGARIQVGGLC